MPSDKPQPIGWKIYLAIILPFGLAGFLLAAWLCRSPEAMARLESSIRAAGILNVTSTATPEAYREAWRLYAGLFTVAGMLVGEVVHPFIRKGPIF